MSKAKIIFKEGREGEMTLDAIKGIAVPRIDGKTILVYPKYQKGPLLDSEREPDWSQPSCSSIKALLEDVDKSKELTDALLCLDSPAAKYVRSIGEQFNIPSLLTTATIKKYRNGINNLAKKIDGADILPNRLRLWSCNRSGHKDAWIVKQDSPYHPDGFIGQHMMDSWLFMVVPVSLF